MFGTLSTIGNKLNIGRGGVRQRIFMNPTSINSLSLVNYLIAIRKIYNFTKPLGSFCADDVKKC